MLSSSRSLLQLNCALSSDAPPRYQPLMLPTLSLPAHIACAAPRITYAFNVSPRLSRAALSAARLLQDNSRQANALITRSSQATDPASRISSLARYITSTPHLIFLHLPTLMIL
ncbi:hypothetical protein IQ07DRAFT_203365 [Pyrenochaeta sp. DS3sAY3a]|nr:hypothetical protein IQ07DRAFT_203365 [Pyrenochaeta sp. DS3sAY3a]